MILSADNCNKFTDSNGLANLVHQCNLKRSIVVTTEHKKNGSIYALMGGTGWRIGCSNFPKEFSAGSPDQHLFVVLRLLSDWFPSDYKLELELAGYSDTPTGYTFTFNYTSHVVN